MKTFKTIFAIVSVAVALVLTGCKKESGGDPFGNVKTGWSESGNTMTYKTMVVSTKADTYDLYYLFTLKFDGETCSSAIWELGCPDAALAASIMAELKSEPDFKEIANLFSVSGRIIKVDITSFFKEIPKSYIKTVVESMAQGY